MKGAGDKNCHFFHVSSRETITAKLEDETGIEATTLPGPLTPMITLALEEFKDRPVGLSHDERKVCVSIG